MIRRALCRASGQDPPRRGKRGKNWKITSQENSLTDDQPPKNEEKTNKENDEKLKLENLKYDTLFVDTQTDLKELFTNHFEIGGHDRVDETFGLIGLHTCGNLAANSLQIFLANDSIKFCCNVGCCYHLLSEEFYTNPYEEKSCDDQKPCFPMSKLLKEQKFSLGKNARMVAAQPMDRSINNKKVCYYI